jgi:hypothetical protein
MLSNIIRDYLAENTATSPLFCNKSHFIHQLWEYPISCMSNRPIHGLWVSKTPQYTQ